MTDRDPRLIDEPTGLFGPIRRRFAQGDLGSLPVVMGLVLIWIIFYILEPRFLSARNLTNLLLQIAAMGIIAVGIVLVLLLAEIDLSVGAVSGFAAAVMAVLSVKAGWGAVPSVAAGLASGALVGAFQGFFITRLRVPSFVVTLAGFLGWQGALLFVLGSTGTVNLNDKGITGIAGTFFPSLVGWIVAVVIVAIYLWATWQERRRRASSNLPLPSMPSTVGRLLLVGIGVFGGVAVVNADRGLPLILVIFIGFIVFFDLLTRRTRFGRAIFAVGGNPEAARRAGINVEGIRWIVFAIAGTMAAAGGIAGASRLLAVNQSSGGGTLLLNAIAAAVIGGTSLFGGRGTAWSALLGALVIGSISNGMDLLALSSSIKFMVTGAVLLAAVTLDSTARRSERRSW